MIYQMASKKLREQAIKTTKEKIRDIQEGRYSGNDAKNRIRLEKAILATLEHCADQSTVGNVGGQTQV